MIDLTLTYAHKLSKIHLDNLWQVSFNLVLPFQACAAYCFITIPSIQSSVAQLQLYLLSGQCALLNQCYSQGMSATQ